MYTEINYDDDTGNYEIKVCTKYKWLFQHYEASSNYRVGGFPLCSG